MQKLSFKFDDTHPTGAGHFPGNPIIPGALLLAEVLNKISKAAKLHLAECKVPSAKFHHPVRPGDLLEIEYDSTENHVIHFKCRVAEQVVLSGVISASIDA